jgi:hypothetical protein
MEMRLAFAPWLPEALRVLGFLSSIGYRITDEDVEALIASATIVDAGDDEVI